VDFYLDQQIKKYFCASQPLFDQLMALRGDCFRHQKGRLTQRIKLGDCIYFIKQHHGVGFKEIIKNMIQGRWPVISAKNEWRAIEKLQALHVSVPKIFAYGQRGLNPARKQSFILMEALSPTISLEEVCKTWKIQAPAFRLKKKLLEQVAQIAKTLHEHGINHRDFYLCHFLLDMTNGRENILTQPLKLSLIDLHRTQIRKQTPLRWKIKDLASLLFSSKEAALTQRDFYRFMKIYDDKSLREIIHLNGPFWQKVKNRGNTYCDHTQRK